MTSWLVLTPAGVTVDVRVSPAVIEPILVTAEQLKAVAIAAATMTEAGLPVDVAELLARLTRGRAPVGLATTAGEHIHQTAPEDRRVWSCVCGLSWTVGTGGEIALQQHQRTCPVHNDPRIQIPPGMRP